MQIEYTWSEHELLVKKCYGCKFLEMYDNFNGKCTVKGDQYNRRLVRYRSLTSAKCSRKERRSNDV